MNGNTPGNRVGQGSCNRTLSVQFFFLITPQEARENNDLYFTYCSWVPKKWLKSNRLRERKKKSIC